jgi:hypothetical protein
MTPDVLARLRALPKSESRKETWQVGILDVDLPPANGTGEPAPIKTRLLVCLPAGSAVPTIEPQSVTLNDGRVLTPPDCGLVAGENPLLHILARHALNPDPRGGKARPHLPHRVHVGPIAASVREELEAVLSPLGVIVEVKPSLEDLDNLREQVRQATSIMSASHPDALIDIPGMTIDRLRAFALAACEFFKAKPWAKFGPVADLWEVTATPACPEMRYLSVMGELGESFGVGFFDSTEAFDRMSKAGPEPDAMFDFINGAAWSASLDPLDASHPKDEAIWHAESLPWVEHGGVRLAGTLFGIRPDRSIAMPTIGMLNLAEAIFRTLSAAKPAEIRTGHIVKTVSTFEGKRTIELRGLHPVNDGPPEMDLYALADLLTDPAVLRRLRRMTQGSGESPPTAKRPRPAAATATPITPAAMYRIRASLQHIRPTIWRDILIRADATFLDLHHALQASLGWTNSHLHAFDFKGRRISGNRLGDMDMEDGSTLRLCDAGVTARSRFHYCYDFGDNWEVDLRVERVLTAAEGKAALTTLAEAPKAWRSPSPSSKTPVAACLDGARAGPPDDCGGPMMYADLCDAATDPNHPDRADFEEMYGPDLADLGGPEGFRPEHFDLRATNAALARYKPPKRR